MIQGEQTRLRALEHSDLADFVGWINDPDVRRFMQIRYPLSMAAEETWWQAFSQQDRDLIFAIENEQGVHIGNIGLHQIERENRQALLGIIIGDKDHWGKGYGSDAIEALLRWAFDNLNLNRIHLTVWSYNTRAIRCYEKCGFRLEGIMRQARYYDGQYHDEWMMAILHDEFLRGYQKEARYEDGQD